MSVRDTPTGIEMIKDAVHGVERLARKVAEQEALVGEKRAELAAHEAELLKRRAAVAAAERRLHSLVASGACATHGCTHGHEAVANTNSGGDVPEVPLVSLDDQSVSIKWRIAFMLLADPVLDYQKTAERLYGPLDPTTAKNRVNAHVQVLRNEGVVKTVGSNRFVVDRQKLAERSGLPVGDPK